MYGSQLGPRELAEQRLSSSLIGVAKIQYLEPLRMTMTVPKPSVLMWNGLMSPFPPIREHSVCGLVLGTAEVVP